MSPDRWCRSPGCDREPLYSQHWCAAHAGGAVRVAQPGNSELEATANEVRRFEEALAVAHEPWLAAMATDCPVHRYAVIGRYCWYSYHGGVRGVCMQRVHRGLVKQAKRARYAA